MPRELAVGSYVDKSRLGWPAQPSPRALSASARGRRWVLAFPAWCDGDGVVFALAGVQVEEDVDVAVSITCRPLHSRFRPACRGTSCRNRRYGELFGLGAAGTQAPYQRSVDALGPGD